MNKDDLRDELPYYRWLFEGTVHLRTMLHTAGWTIIVSIIIEVFK